MRFGKVQKCSDFWRNLGKWEENFGQGFEVNLELEKTWGIFASVFMGDSENGIFYNSSLNIGRVCYIEKSPCEFPQFKWIEDPYDLVVEKKMA